MPSKNARLKRRKNVRRRRENAKRREELKQADKARRESADKTIIREEPVSPSKNTWTNGIGKILRPSNASKSQNGIESVHEAAIKAKSMKPNPNSRATGGPGRGVKIAMVIAVLAMMALLVVPGFL